MFTHLLSGKEPRKRSGARNGLEAKEGKDGRSEERVFCAASDRNWMDDKES